MLVTVFRGFLGILALIFIAYLFSRNRRAVDWTQIAVALLLQLVLGVAILYVPFVGNFIEVLGRCFVKILDFTHAGSKFLFGDLVDVNKVGYIFVFQVLPVTVFFAALTSILYFYGVIQWVVGWIAWGLRKLLYISGAEGLVAAGNIFLGQTESPLLTKKYLSDMSDSELFLVMVSGMATIAGGVMAAYILMLGDGDPQATVIFAKHLISASVMAAPGTVVIAKIIFPETGAVRKEAMVSSDSVGANFFDALSNGTIEGVKLAVNIAGMLLVIIALVAFLNYLLGGLIGRYTGLNEWILAFSGGRFDGLSLEFIMSLAFTPVAWLIGVAREDVPLVAALLGKKIAINEFVAYADLAAYKEAGAFVYQRSVIIATYLLCGFANLASIGIQIGGIGSLAPNKKLFLTRFGLLAVVGATLVSCMSATLIGILI